MALSCSPSMDTKAAKYDENIVGPCSFIQSNSALQTPQYYEQFSLSLGKESPYIFSKFNSFNEKHVKINSLYGPLNECLYQWGLTVYVKGTAMKLIILPQASRIHVYAQQIKHETKLA